MFIGGFRDGTQISVYGSGSGPDDWSREKYDLRLARARKIPVIQVGKRYVINAEMFDEWFQEQCANRAVIEL